MVVELQCLGGVTSLFEMPNTNPPTSNLIEFEKKLQLAKDRMHSNYAFYFGATPENTEQLSQLKNLKGMLWDQNFCWILNREFIS